MKTDHTPGPWFVAKAKPRRVCGKDGVSICNAILRNQGGPKAKAHLKDEHEAEANALLIAAAPCQHAVMLELDKWSLVILSAVRHDAPSDHDAIVALIKANRAAIARATGVIPATPLPRVENVR